MEFVKELKDKSTYAQLYIIPETKTLYVLYTSVPKHLEHVLDLSIYITRMQNILGCANIVIDASMYPNFCDTLTYYASTFLHSELHTYVANTDTDNALSNVTQDANITVRDTIEEVFLLIDESYVFSPNFITAIDADMLEENTILHQRELTIERKKVERLKQQRKTLDAKMKYKTISIYARWLGWLATSIIAGAYKDEIQAAVNQLIYFIGL